MANQHAQPMENAPVPVIKSGDKTICKDAKDFDLICKKLLGQKEPGEYEGLKMYIVKKCGMFHMQEKVYEVIGHVCEVAYRKATVEGGWQVDNHIAYLYRVAKNKIYKELKAKKKAFHEFGEEYDDYGNEKDVNGAWENQEIIQKSMKLLKKKYPNDFLIIQAMYGGYEKNEELAKVVGRTNDAAFRKAKDRAKDRLKEAVLDVMGRGPDRFRMMNDKTYEFKYISNKNIFITDFNIYIPNKNKKQGQDIIIAINQELESIHDRYVKFIRSIFEDVLEMDEEGHNFTVKPEWLKAAA